MSKKIIDFTKKIYIQSMTNTKTKDVDNTVKQIDNLFKLGCDFVRVAVFDDDDLKALEKIVKLSPIPIIADIHFNYKYALTAINYGVAKIRLNPGNISNKNEIIEIIKLAKQKDVWIRIGVNQGSVSEKILEKNNYNYVDSMIESLDEYLKIFQEENFEKIVISLKCSDPLLNIKVNEIAHKKYKYPIHLGVTEAGTLVNSCLKSAIGLAPLLLNGIGNTIRISISDNPELEIKVAYKLLNILKINTDRVNIISCPTCGRLNYDMFDLVNKVEKYCEDKFFPLHISILGCVVNGIGEGKMADIGIAGSNDKALLFENGKIIKTIAANKAFDEIKQLIDKKYNEYLNSK